MFTNWLTGTGSSSASASATTSNRSHTTETPNILPRLTSGSNNLTNLNANIISTPPDVVLEVGPGPQTVRYLAHSIMLGMHSGYLRSAIRMDERLSGADSIVYLTNVTNEQFSPLLSYMYTGFLELNVENIFGVLLATHVLHMPRALEICRSYLARGQADGFFAPHNNSNLQNTLNNSTVNSTRSGHLMNSNIIRPIASKPQLTNFGFLPMTPSLKLAPLKDNRSTTLASLNPGEKSPDYDATQQTKDDNDDDIEVDEIEKQSVNSDKNHVAINDDDDEDVEVFIDTNSETDVLVETDICKLSYTKVIDFNQGRSKELAPIQSKPKQEKSNKKSSHKHDKQRRRGNLIRTSNNGLQVAKAPIPASQLDTSDTNKVIIDVASCDGPVRFKRILNTAYGHKPETSSSDNHSGSDIAVQERSFQSVSLSFHQQMAKNISQQQLLNNAEESENSETSNGSGGGSVGGTIGKNGRKVPNEVFACIYCRHTFKSQYCYQKHAKRHLNPLTLQATCVPSSSADKRTDLQSKKISTLTDCPATSKSQHLYNAGSIVVRDSLVQTNQTSNNGLLHSTTEFLKREVRPLDMNVQYYPCKTCGSKFPSYYFVHKHRKMCHTDEENQQANQTATTTTTATISAPVVVKSNDTPDDSTNFNSKSGD